MNLADQTVYPSSFDLHDRCVSMIAKLWHAPDGFAGAGTVGSTEACLLAGLALKFRWRAAHAKKLGKPAHDPAVRGAYPNLVISTMFQAAWEKLFKYMDIEPRFVTPSVQGPEYEGSGWRMEPGAVADKIDEHTSPLSPFPSLILRKLFSLISPLEHGCPRTTATSPWTRCPMCMTSLTIETVKLTEKTRFGLELFTFLGGGEGP